MSEEERVRATLEELFRSQRFAVLATQDAAQPYVSLMAFAATPDLKQLIFVTDRDTHKYANLRANPHTAILIDDRSNQDADVHTAIAVTLIGRAEEVTGAERERLLGVFVGRHPYLEAFARSPTSALIRVQVERAVLVSRFQEVRELQLG
jgi:nitroimidazol reductase NimA-like FMN-containing flavoprotein (pyridoxamine 5'-phosphate oxidase superfamily)